MSASVVAVQRAQKALDLYQPEEGKKEKDKEIGFLDSRRVATIVTLGVASALAATAAAVVSIFSTYIVMGLCVAAVVSIVIAAIIASRIDLSKDLVSLIEKMSRRIENLFKSNQNLAVEIEKLKAHPEGEQKLEEVNPMVEELRKEIEKLRKELDETKAAKPIEQMPAPVQQQEPPKRLAPAQIQEPASKALEETSGEKLKESVAVPPSRPKSIPKAFEEKPKEEPKENLINPPSRPKSTPFANVDAAAQAMENMADELESFVQDENPIENIPEKTVVDPKKLEEYERLQKEFENKQKNAVEDIFKAYKKVFEDLKLIIVRDEYNEDKKIEAAIDELFNPQFQLQEKEIQKEVISWREKNQKEAPLNFDPVKIEMQIDSIKSKILEEKGFVFSQVCTMGPKSLEDLKLIKDKLCKILKKSARKPVDKFIKDNERTFNSIKQRMQGKK